MINSICLERSVKGLAAIGRQRRKVAIKDWQNADEESQEDHEIIVTKNSRARSRFDRRVNRG